MTETINKQQETEKIAEEIRGCKKCRLWENRTNTVPGSGSSTASVMFIGEGPGGQEDKTGIPFTGAAGNFLNELLASAGIRRDDIFITNVVKCRPPNNRDPQDDEKQICLPYLRRQVSIIRPRMICTLGRHALMTLVSPNLSISRVHGKVFKKKNFYFLALYHPAAALYNPQLKETLKQDIMVLKEENYNYETLL